MSRKRVISWKVWIIAGVVLLIGAAGLYLYNVYDAARADKAAQETLVELQGDIEDSENLTDAENDSSSEMDTITIDGYDYIGYIEVPSLDLTLPIMEECDNARLKLAPCRYAGTLADQDLVIAGHNYRKHFSQLRYLDAGAEIHFIDVHGNVTRFEISYVDILEPTQIEDMITADGDWDLTLFTCTLSGNARYAIRCIQTK